nr:hypothetical protein [Tanacetum cinerariifolium]
MNPYFAMNSNDIEEERQPNSFDVVDESDVYFLQQALSIMKLSWHGQYGRGDKEYPTVILEVVASRDLWIWHAFFFVAGANNDINVLDNCSLFDDLLDDNALVAPYVLNGVEFEKRWHSTMPKPKQTVRLSDWVVLFDRHNEVACLMLGTMSPKLYQQFEHNSPLEMVTELQKMYGKPPGVELQELRNKQPIVGASSTPQVMAIQGGRDQKYKPQGKAKGKGKGKGPQNSYPIKPKKPQPYKKEHPAKDGQCHHSKEEGHWKRNCLVYLVELMKKKKKTGGQNIASTSSGAKKLKSGSLYLYVGNGVRAEVEAIGSFDLVLPNGLIIVLDNCHYTPSITRGVVSVSRLVDKGFTQCFTNFELSVLMNNILYFNAITVNGIYEIDMRDSTLPIVNSMYSISNKRTKSNLDSTYLWHCRLAHINKKRIEKLQHGGLLKSTDNEPFDQFVSCTSGKMTRKPFSHKTEKVKDVLGLIHTDVCGPLRHVSKKCTSYFITFTDDYSRYPNETMGYYFYYPPENKIVVERYADFSKKDFILQKESGRIVKLEDEDILPSENTSEHSIQEKSLAPIVSQEEDVILVRRSVRTHKAPD